MDDIGKSDVVDGGGGGCMAAAAAAVATPKAEDIEQLSSYPLHECVFQGDVQEFARLMRSEDLSRKDKHGTYVDVFGDYDIDTSICYVRYLSYG